MIIQGFVLFWAIAQAQATSEPCAAGLTAKATPCAESSVATIDGTTITMADLDEATRKRVEGLDAAIAEARQKALREEIDDLLLELEAARRGVSVGQLYVNEVIAKVTRATDQEVAAEIAANAKRYTRGKEDSEWAEGTIFDRRVVAREKELITSLETRFPVTVGAGGDAVLATVGQRKLTAARARPRLEAAAADVRMRTWGAQRKALDRLIEERHLGQGHDIRVLIDAPSPPQQQILVEHAPALGPADAKVTLIEFGDFECPPCGRMAAAVDEALRPLQRRVRYIFRQYPLNIHRYAWKAAEAALAAHAQGKFFPYAHILFANQKSLDVEALKRYASEAGLDRKRFDEDLDSGRFAADVITDKRQGRRAGVRSTPAFFLNGVQLGEESYDPEGLRVAIERAVAAAGK